MVACIRLTGIFCQARAAHSLLSITHSLKLLFLLSDDAQVIKKRDKELKETQAEAEMYRGKVIELLDELFAQKTEEQRAEDEQQEQQEPDMEL